MIIESDHQCRDTTNERVLEVILVASRRMAERVIHHHLGSCRALEVGLRRWARAKCAHDRILVVPPECAHVSMVSILPLASAFGFRIVQSDGREVFDTAVAEALRVNAYWIAPISIADVFLDGVIVDHCLMLTRLGCPDFVYGDGFPNGLSPLLIGIKTAQTLMPLVRQQHPAADRAVLESQLLSVPGLTANRYPAPLNARRPDVDLSLTSAVSAMNLEHMTKDTAEGASSLSTYSLINRADSHRRIRMRAASRFASLRPKSTEILDDSPPSTPTGVLFLYFRSEKVGGGEASLENLKTGLDRTHYTPQLATPFSSGGLFEGWHKANLPAFAVPILEWPQQGSPSDWVIAAAQLARSALRHNTKVICASDIISSSAFGFLLATLMGTPLVTRLLAPVDLIRIDQSMALFADRIVVPSQFVASHCLKAGIPKDRIRVVHEGIDPQWLRKPSRLAPDLRRTLCLPEHTLLIGVVSRLGDPQKAIENAIYASKYVINAIPEARVVICGKTPDHLEPVEPELAKLIDDLGLTNHVRLAGFFEDMRPIYPQFDVLLHPAPDEPFGLVVTESMAQGVPPVAVSGGGIPEQVINGVHGILTPTNSPDDLGRAVCALLADRDLRLNMGYQAHCNVRDRFTSSHFAKAFEGVLTDLLAGELFRASQHSVARVLKRSGDRHV